MAVDKNPPDSEKLEFKPMTQGLGFHPFSEGLPYSTPENASGTGATAAGKPRFVPAPPPIATAPPVVAQPRAFPKSQPSLSTLSLKEKRLPVIVESTSSFQAGQAGFETFSGFYLPKRVLAFLFDVALNSSICVGALFLILQQMKIPFQSLLAPDALALFLSFVAIFNWALIAAQEIAFLTTVGKRIFGLNLGLLPQDGSSLEISPTRVLLRAIVFPFSALFLGLGLIWPVFNQNRSTWHDLISGIQPLESAEL